MIHRRLATVAILLAACTLPLAAQAASRLSVGVGIGAGAPLDDLAEGFKPAFAGQGYVQYRLGDAGLSVRADLGWHYFDTKSNSVTPLARGTVISGNVTSFTAGGALVYHFAAVSDFRPYLLAGGTSVTASTSIRSRTSLGNRYVSNTETAFSPLVGAGADFVLVGTRVFVEARWMSASMTNGTLGVVPVTAGFRF